MTTLTLKVPDDLARKIESASLRKRTSKSRIIRDALAVTLRHEKPAPTLHDRMEKGLGCVDSGRKDLATNPRHLRGLGAWRK